MQSRKWCSLVLRVRCRTWLENDLPLGEYCRMQKAMAAALARELLTEHQLHDWQFAFDHARVRCGSCHYRTRQISLSRHFVALNDTYEVNNVLLHEIAHALAGPGVGHGAAWQELARRLGARPETRAPQFVAMPAPSWSLVCRGCRQIVAQRHRRVLDLTRVRCRTCGVQDGELIWQSN